jgi:hypothetical protein
VGGGGGGKLRFEYETKVAMTEQGRHVLEGMTNGICRGSYSRFSVKLYFGGVDNYKCEVGLDENLANAV